MPRLASILQPKGQELHWTQLPALREIGPPEAPSAAAPSIASWPLRPIRSGSSGVTRRNCSASAKAASRSAAQSMPKRLRHSSSTGRGARKQVPELTTVVPPTVRRHRHRDLRPALGDRQAAVAVELGDRLERVGRVAVAVEALAGLEHDHVEPRLGQGRRRDGPPAPEPTMTTSHSSPSPRGLGVAERAARLRQRAVGEAAAALEADPLLDLGRRPRSPASRRPWPSAAARGGGRSASPPCAAGSPRARRGRGG